MKAHLWLFLSLMLQRFLLKWSLLLLQPLQEVPPSTLILLPLSFLLIFGAAPEGSGNAGSCPLLHHPVTSPCSPYHLRSDAAGQATGMPSPVPCRIAPVPFPCLPLSFRDPSSSRFPPLLHTLRLPPKAQSMLPLPRQHPGWHSLDRTFPQKEGSHKMQGRRKLSW